MKVLITAAGLGRRTGLNGHVRKEMLPIYECREGRLVLRPIIEVIINRYKSYGLREFVVVLGRNDRRSEYYVREFCPDVEIVFQESPRGFGDAVLKAADLIDGKFILNSGDGMLFNRKDTDRFMDTVKSGKFSQVLGLMRVDNPSRYGVASVSESGGSLEVKGVVEKPSKPEGNLALVAVYQLDSSVFGELESFTGDNIELTPAINNLIRNGHRTAAVEFERKNWLSVNRVEDYLRVLRNTYDLSVPCQ